MIEAFETLDGDLLFVIVDGVRNEVLTPIFITITKLGDMGFVWMLISLFLLAPKKTRKIGVMSLFSLFLSAIINNMLLKNLIVRTRPYEVVEGVTALIKELKDFSFPSGHTASSFAVASILLRKFPKKYGISAIALATLIGFSRLYLGVHYPSDVIVGAGSGIAVGYLAEYMVCKVEKRNR